MLGEWLPQFRICKFIDADDKFFVLDRLTVKHPSPRAFDFVIGGSHHVDMACMHSSQLFVAHAYHHPSPFALQGQQLRLDLVSKARVKSCLDRGPREYLNVRLEKAVTP